MYKLSVLEKHVLWLAHCMCQCTSCKLANASESLFEDHIMSQQHVGKNSARLLLKTELLLASDAAKHIHKAN